MSPTPPVHLAFYEGILGMAVLPRPDFSFGGAWLDAGNGRQIHLIEGDVPPSLGQHVAFRVDDVDTTVAKLRAAGVDASDAKHVGDTAIRQAFAERPRRQPVGVQSAVLISRVSGVSVCPKAARRISTCGVSWPYERTGC